MTLATSIELLPVESIIVARDERQRQELDVTDLVGSIAKRGVLHPIVIDADGVLVAGERRLEACRQLDIPVPCRRVTDLTPLELQLIEAEENFKRKDLTWVEQVKAVARIHALFRAADPEWTLSQTAEEISLAKGTVSEYLTAAANLHNAHVATAPTARAAFNVVKRVEQRKASAELEELLEPKSRGERIAEVVAPVESSEVECQSFLDWAPQYSGAPFNFIHCDFPYGANLFGGAQGQRGLDETEQYSDDRETFFELLDCFAKNFNNFAGHSCHLMFWFTFPYYEQIKATFRNYVPDLVFARHPLVWVKSDGRGIIGDVRRDPRHVYEAALFARRGDRVVVRSKLDAYSAPTDTTLHPSAKPEPMLRHFFEMVCDEHTELLDPTCGGGSALRAAESLGAKRLLGLELNPGYAEAAARSLRAARVLAKGARMVKENNDGI